MVVKEKKKKVSTFSKVGAVKVTWKLLVSHSLNQAGVRVLGWLLLAISSRFFEKNY